MMLMGYYRDLKKIRIVGRQLNITKLGEESGKQDWKKIVRTNLRGKPNFKHRHKEGQHRKYDKH